jgi:hypothetical protein
MSGLKPQARLILGLLRTHRDGITTLEALVNGAGFRLSGRIHELRAAGYPIETDWETTPNGARIARYRLVDQPEQMAAGF